MRGERVVLVVVRTPAALHRLLDVVPVFAGDARIETVFTVDRGSQFSAGLTARLIALGAQLIPWHEALIRRFDLAIAASDNGELHRIRAPLLLLPHGVGYQRYAPSEPGAISGMRRSTLVRGRRLVPGAVALAHPHQRDTVRAVEPRLLPRTVVVGDPCLDRIILSAHHRDRYRAAFGADGRTLVVLCSTWGPHSLYGRQPHLPAAAVGALDRDRHRVALVLHPNVWAWHGDLQLRTWLRPAVEAGLIVVPPEEGWRAAIVAADVVVSDHSSLTSYAVAAGRPVLLAADGGPEVVPGSPSDVMRRKLPALRGDAGIAEQLRAARPAPELVDGVFAHRGDAVALLRDTAYRLLRMEKPATPVRAEPVPVPELAAGEPTALAVRASTAHTGAAVAVTLHRFPAARYDEEQTATRHLAVDTAERNPGWLERAAVVWRTDPRPAADARDWADAVLHRLHGTRVAVAATSDGAIAVVRDGPTLTMTTTAHPAQLGSALHACRLHALDPCSPGGLTIHTGPTTTHLHPRPFP